MSTVSVKSGCSGAPKPDRLGLSGKANKCSNARAGDPGVLTTHQTPSLKLAVTVAVGKGVMGW